MDVEPCIQVKSRIPVGTSVASQASRRVHAGEEPDADGDLDGEQCSMDGVIGDELAANSGESSTKVVGEYDTTLGGTITSQKGGHLRHGRRISVQATAAGRRKGTGLMSKGKLEQFLEDQSNPQRMKKGVTSVLDIFLPTRRPPKGRRPHSLKANVDKTLENGS